MPGSTRSRSIRIPSPFAEILALLVIAALAVLGVMIFIPLVIVAVLGLMVFVAITWVRLKFRGAKAPNGPLDGRRNVRVIERDE